MKCVLVGGVGFLGAVLGGVLAARGCSVVVAGRRGRLDPVRKAIVGHLERAGCSVVFLDKLDEGSLSSLGGDVYFHLAGRISGSLSEFRDSHVELLGRVVSAASSLGARVVYVSSIGAVGEIRGVKPGSVVYEEEELQGGERVYHSYYEATKAEGEKLLSSRSRELRGKWAIVRPGLMMGPWAYHSEWRTYLKLLKLRIAPRLGVGMPIVHVEDVAEVLAEAGEGRYDGLWLHAVSPEYPDYSDLVAEGCRMLGRRCFTVPLSPLSSLGLLLLHHLAPRGSPQALIASMLRLRYRYASRHLRREWRSLEDMVAGFLNWAREWAQIL